MPPEPPLPEQNDSHEQGPLTDENVSILYQIIKFAEQYPEVASHPFRAIFSAYDTILPENGLDSQHDQVYLRFLFKLGDRRGDGESLFETFEKLLIEFGIQIEFNAEDDGIQEVTRNLADLGYENEEEAAQDAADPIEQLRRASFNSMYDAEDESAGVGRSRADSRASMSRLQTSKKTVANARPASRATTRPTERTSKPAKPTNAAAATARRRLTPREWTQDLQQQHDDTNSMRGGDQRAQRNNITNAAPDFLQRAADSEAEASSSSTGDDQELATGSPDYDIQEDQPFVLVNEGKFSAPSKTQLLRDADTFHSYRVRSVARDIVEKWCYAAVELKIHKENMHRIATAHDREILLRQAFEHWRLRLHEKKQATETKRYFERLERRATRARELYLLTKAFTHWSQCARDEVLGTSLARRHILSIKYFHAWKDLTIINQNEIHLQGLRKYFSIWKQCYVQTVTNDIKADLAYQRRLIRSAYWHWFWEFCNARAPEWQVRKLKQRYLLKWQVAFQANRRRNQQVTLRIEIAAKKFFASHWLDKARRMLINQNVAITHNQQTLSARVLNNWVRTRRLGPLVQQMSNMVDWRVAGATFATFVNRYRLQKQSESLDRLRVKRNAWTQWNDHLRWQTMARRIDDRYVLEALYRWTIAERFSLLRRLVSQRLKQRYLLKLGEHWSMRETQRNFASRIIETQLTRSSLRLILSQWQLRCNAISQNRQIAIKFHAPRVTYEALKSMSQRLQQVQALNTMAQDACFYFATKRSLCLWHAIAIESKHQKRRNAYIQIRRQTKMNLALTMLRYWHSATEAVQDMATEAVSFDQNRLLRLGTAFFTQWRNLSDLEIDQQLRASNHYEEIVLLRHLRTWSKRTINLMELDRMALLNADLQRQGLAFDCLNKLRLRLIELKGPQATAENLKVRYEKRHFYNMLRHWQDRTVSRIDRPAHGRAPFSATSRRTRLLGEADDRFGATARAKEWTELDQGEWVPQLVVQHNSTRPPGYLSTPSKRAARARALIQESTTPVGTPFLARLGAPFNSTPKVLPRGLFGRSMGGPPKSNVPVLPVDGSGSTTVVGRDE